MEMAYRYFILSIFLFISYVISAQTPQRFNYQAVVRNASNTILVNQPVGIRISLLQGSATGTAVFVETHSLSTNTYGQVMLEIGGGTLVSGSIVSINWATGTYFIKTETDPSGGSNYSLSATTRLLSVPYAMHAGNGLGAGSANNQILYWNGSGWIVLNPGVNGQVLTICNGILTWTFQGVCPETGFPCSIVDDFNPSITYGSMTDQEGNVYKTVTIGTQVWMAENLRTGRYRNGDPIPNVVNGATWGGMTSGASCWYNNDSASYHSLYGRLYNWYAVSETRNLCPSGWHVPTDSEWIKLVDTLGGATYAGTVLKSACAWKNNWSGTNTSGFTARPGGFRAEYNNSTFAGLVGANGAGQGQWWTATKNDQTSSPTAWYRQVGPSLNISRGSYGYGLGQSVRCVKD